MALITPFLVLFKESKSWKSIVTPGLVSNIFVTLLFAFCRKCPPICQRFPAGEDQEDGCSFDYKEVEILIFLVCVMVIKNQKSVSVQQTITNMLMYAKLANIVMFYRVDFRLSIVYSLVCLLRMWCFPENFGEMKEKLLHFNDKTLEETLKENPKIVWVVQFYTTWSPACRASLPAFSAVSLDYCDEHLRYGKIDIGKYPDSGVKYGISTSSMSQQLPTIIVFEDGKPTNWRPMIDTKNKKFIKYFFSQENIVRDFALSKLLNDAQAKTKAMKKNKKAKSE